MSKGFLERQFVRPLETLVHIWPTAVTRNVSQTAQKLGQSSVSVYVSRHTVYGGHGRVKAGRTG